VGAAVERAVHGGLDGGVSRPHPVHDLGEGGHLVLRAVAAIGAGRHHGAHARHRLQAARAAAPAGRGVPEDGGVADRAGQARGAATQAAVEHQAHPDARSVVEHQGGACAGGPAVAGLGESGGLGDVLGEDRGASRRADRHRSHGRSPCASRVARGFLGVRLGDRDRIGPQEIIDQATSQRPSSPPAAPASPGSRIAKHLGTSPQAAQQRYGSLAEPA
jgi:hypothetical protein